MKNGKLNLAFQPEADMTEEEKRELKSLVFEMLEQKRDCLHDFSDEDAAEYIEDIDRVEFLIDKI